MLARRTDYDETQIVEQWRRRIRQEEANALALLQQPAQRRPVTARYASRPVGRTDIRDVLCHSAYVKPQMPAFVEHQHQFDEEDEEAAGASRTLMSGEGSNVSGAFGNSSCEGRFSRALVRAGKEIERERFKRKMLEREVAELRALVERTLKGGSYSQKRRPKTAK
ncbi:unnamed protein product [Vitrella brassicaformis CCMP3155]|uniref:Uncharacterized protein n=1 Tax=Vitrella brassicaformis (strain CCMP3155) TaxID=1169540 RepID=A0A0G4EV51_VITBC|nr:unnamed protein product [Vitrella brassicaformis CCMP3155]|mmetsp:Transcript_31060/g.76986  ORF Transcript_31060/g.76986 Transcript_31060/m.76986 type:complete len:166 (-) Transcript_31060:1008-1505(-)|eukprot:CEM02217.1 unnamed protein product [Vitrella brassicaformis CCMP3155]